MKRHPYNCINTLQGIGIAYRDAFDLRRISMTLSRWHEGECGAADGTCIERDEATGKPFRTWDTGNSGKRGRMAIPEMEAGALKRLKAIMANYPTLTSYVQGDPRGAALYILRPGDVPEGEDAGSYYSRGVAVCK